MQNPSSPVAQMSVDKLSKTVHCTQDSFYFVDQSIVNHRGAHWLWQFPGGSPATDTSLYPVVTYATAGNYTAVLTVSDSSGNQSTDSLTISIDNFQAPSFVDESFESAFPPFPIELFNPDNGQTWEQSSLAGGYGLSTQAAWFNNFDYWPGGDEDDLRMSINFVQPSSTWLKFDVAYAQYGNNYSDSLEVLVSTDCGLNFQSVYFKGGSDLATSADISTAFVPLANEWRTDSVDLSSFNNQAEIMLAFRNHSGWGNNIFLDNINLSNPIISKNILTKPLEIVQLYPNPVSSEAWIYFSNDQVIDFKLYDLQGKLVLAQKGVAKQLQLPCLSAGAYVYSLLSNTAFRKGKLIVR
jgi:PKD repeat protein